jgi:hypothetical protein
MSDDFICVACNEHCGTKRAYDKHQNSNTHRTNVGLPPLEYPCPSCHKTFSRQSEVKRHLANGKCSGRNPRVNAGASNAIKHGLSVSPADVAWKYRRTTSPAGDRFPGVLDARRDSANIRLGTVGSDLGSVDQVAADGLLSTAPLQAMEESTKRSFSLKEALSARVYDVDIATPDTPETVSAHHGADSPSSAVVQPISSLRNQQGYLTAAVQTTMARTIAESGNALDRTALAESLDTLSYEEFKKWKSKSGQKVTEARAIAQRLPIRSFSLLSLDPSSANPDSLDGLFGMRRMAARAHDSMESPMYWRPYEHQSATSVAERIRVSNGHKLVEHAANGHDREVYEILMYNDVDVNYSDEALHDGATAIMAAAVHGHVGVLDAILRALTSNTSANRLHIQLDVYQLVCVGGQNRKFLKALRGFVRVLVGTVSCLCPQEMRIGTLCEEVARRPFDAKATKSECCWGDKLRRSSWPDFSDLSLRIPDWRSVLPRTYTQPDEQSKIQAHRIRVQAEPPKPPHERTIPRSLLRMLALPTIVNGGKTDDSDEGFDSDESDDSDNIGQRLRDEIGDDDGNFNFRFHGRDMTGDGDRYPDSDDERERRGIPYSSPMITIAGDLTASYWGEKKV